MRNRVGTSGVERIARNLRPHSFRHTFNSLLPEKRYHAAEIRDALGWSDESIQDNYTDWCDSGLSEHRSFVDDALKGRTTVMGHDAGTDWNGAKIEAIPAYNKDPATKFHPRARGDNGYVLTMAGFRVYISGDTEDIPEMRALQNIDLAFVCMNLPFTMTAEAAASAVAEFKPKFVYPYHYRGRDDGTQDPKAFASLVGDAAEVHLVDWYPDDPDL